MSKTLVCIRLLLLSCTLGAAGIVHAESRAHQLLAQMNDAFINLTYDGIFTYFDGSDLASLRVVHKVVDGVQRERLVHLNGAPREIVRDGDDVSCIVMPGDDLIALQQSIPSGPFARAFVRQFDRITDTYQLGEFGEGRVAGRVARRIGVEPKDEHRYGYRLWVDANTALLLRSELVDRSGRQLEVFMFNSVRFGNEVDDSALQPQRGTGAMINHLTLQPASAPDRRAEQGQRQGAGGDTAGHDWQAGWLPAGFKMASLDLREKPATGAMVSNLMYSDGLATFSLFIEPMPVEGAASMVSRNGATVAVTHGLDTSDGSFLLTLVGEIPVATARRIIDSVYLNQT